MHKLYCMSVGKLTAVCQRYLGDSEDVKDVLQDSYIKIFGAFGKFVPQNENSLDAWMTRIVVNESLNFLRQRNRYGWIETTDDIPDVQEEETPDTPSVSTEQLYDMICRLPAGYRTVINLYAIEGHSHKEIAEMLGISEYTSASQLLRAKRALAKMINKMRTSK